MRTTQPPTTPCGWTTSHLPISELLLGLLLHTSAGFVLFALRFGCSVLDAGHRSRFCVGLARVRSAAGVRLGDCRAGSSRLMLLVALRHLMRNVVAILPRVVFSDAVVGHLH